MAAYDDLVLGFGSKPKRSREAQGDFLAMERPSLLLDDSMLVAPCFSSLFQGDHLGVELACDAHAGMLRSFGLLCSDSRLWATRCVVSDRCVEGLYIDDYFSVSKEEVNSFLQGDVPQSTSRFKKAKEIYQREKVAGSDAKDVVNALKYTLPGAEINSSLDLVRRGAITCGLAAEKRLSLATVASMSAALSCTSDALHASLVGSLVSLLTFRKPAMSLLRDVFKVIPPAELNTQDPQLWPLKRSAAGELALVSALCPVLVSDLTAPVSSRIYTIQMHLCRRAVSPMLMSPRTWLRPCGEMRTREERMSPFNHEQLQWLSSMTCGLRRVLTMLTTEKMIIFG